MKKIFTKRNAYYLFLILIGTAIFFRPPIDPDFGWHYKYGEYLFQNHKLLKENIFSYTNTDYRWVNSYWLSELTMYVSHHFLGNVIPTVVLSTALSAFILFILRKNSESIFSISFLHIYVCSTLSPFSLTIRPFYYSTIFLIFLIHTLLKNRKLPVFLPIIFIFWANIHADFVIALFIIGVYSLSEFLTVTHFPKIFFKDIFPPWKKREGNVKTLKNIMSWVSETVKDKKLLKNIYECFNILTLCFIATLVNPYGIGLWGTLFKELTLPIKSYVAEWGPSLELSSSSLLTSVFLALGLMSGVTSKQINESKYRGWYRFLIIFFYIPLFKAVYFMRIFAIISSFAVLDKINLLKIDISRVTKDATKNILKKAAFPGLLFIFIAISPNLIENIEKSSDVSLWSEIRGYPWEAVKYVKENPMEGNMLNDYGWGGYLIWQLPEYKTFIDGRMTSWRINGEYFMEDYRKIFYKTRENKDLLEEYINKYNITWVINKPDSNIVKYLKSEKPDKWNVSFENENSVIMYRSH